MTDLQSTTRSTQSGNRLPLWLALAATVLLSAPANAVGPHLVLQGPRWPPPMRVGMARPVQTQPAPRKRRRWCNYAAHNQRLQPLPMATDPVFRRPDPATGSSLKTLVKSIATLPKGAAAPANAAAKMNALIASGDGPTLARIALQDRDERVRTLAARATTSIIARHPRLAAFAMEDMTKVGAELATAAVQTLLAARCDTPAVHATDGLEHRHAEVRRQTVLGVLRTAAGWTDIGLMGQVLDRAKVEPDPLIRALIARGIAELGWLPGEPIAAHLMTDQDARVRGEALVALAGLRRRMDIKPLQAALKSRDPIVKAAAIRALPLAMSEDPATARGWLKALLKDRGRVVDPLGVSESTTVAALAERAMRRLTAADSGR